MRIAYSSEGGGSDIRSHMGNAHYSYRFVEERFARCFVRAGYDIAKIDNPEIFKSAHTYQALLGAPAADVVHVTFRSTENIRILSGAYNIGHFAWEFDVLRDHHRITEGVTSNQVHMLRLLDEIWVSCAYTRDVLHRHGLDNVSIVPVPACADAGATRLPFERAEQVLSDVPVVPLFLSSGAGREMNARVNAEQLSSLGAQKAVRERSGRIFLSLCNPHDCRKNLLNIIEGFQLAAGDSDDDLLVLKLVVPNTDDFRATATYDTILPRFDGPAAVADPRIVIIYDYLADAEMAALYSLADFFISAAHCEGFNLPLVEAMSYGTLPIATLNTAMCDYIAPDNAVIVPQRRYPAPVVGLGADVAGRIYDLAVASRFDIAGAIVKAKALGESAHRAMAGAARAAVTARYGETRVMGLLQQRFASHVTEVAHAA